MAKLKLQDGWEKFSSGKKTDIIAQLMEQSHEQDAIIAKLTDYINNYNDKVKKTQDRVNVVRTLVERYLEGGRDQYEMNKNDTLVANFENLANRIYKPLDDLMSEKDIEDKKVLEVVK